MAAIVFFIIVFTLILTFFSCIKTAKKEAEIDSDREVTKFCTIILNVRKYAYGIFFAVLFLVAVLDSVYTVSEQQTGCIEVLGNVSMIDGTGLKFKIPFFSKKHVYQSTVQHMAIGYNPENEEVISEEAIMISSDSNFLDVDFDAVYCIKDPIEYTYGSDVPEEILRNICIKSIRKVVGLNTADDVMTIGKSKIEADVLADVQNELNNVHTGLRIIQMSMQDADPPTEQVRQAFSDVNDAKSEKEKAINDAVGEAKKETESAEAKAAETISFAEASKTEKINQAKTEVARFNALYDEYIQNPEIVKEKMYLDMVKSVYPKMNIIIGENGSVVQVNSASDNAISAAGIVEGKGKSTATAEQ